MLGNTILLGSLSLALALSVATLARVVVVRRAIAIDEIHLAADAVENGTVIALNERRLQQLENLHGVERRALA
jgi:HAMP domain-containing protein